ncbi:hypothetical protein DPMN_017251 [Dreissena polymorpha]|uniref:Uncharacterized protein n=1 Tax=Dreissena polymorpha TaxID=45954 RepID=A0A9D4NEH8_DREPO|nr:hypothetical protein DPMN_017251 [Dreissena polymorpha]
MSVCLIWNREVPGSIPIAVGEFSGWVTLAPNVGRQCNPARKFPDRYGDRTRDLPVPNQADTLPRRYKS